MSVPSLDNRLAASNENFFRALTYDNLKSAVRQIVSSGIDVALMVNQVGRIIRDNPRYKGDVFKALDELFKEGFQDSQDIKEALDQTAIFDLQNKINDKKQGLNGQVYIDRQKPDPKLDTNTIVVPKGQGGIDHVQ